MHYNRNDTETGRLNTLNAYMRDQRMVEGASPYGDPPPPSPGVYSHNNNDISGGSSLLPDELPVSSHFHHSRVANQVYAAAGLLPPDWESEDSDDEDDNEGDALSSSSSSSLGNYMSPDAATTSADPSESSLRAKRTQTLQSSRVGGGGDPLKIDGASAPTATDDDDLDIERYIYADRYYNTQTAQLARSGVTVSHPYSPLSPQQRQQLQYQQQQSHYLRSSSRSPFGQSIVNATAPSPNRDDPYADESRYPPMAAVVDRKINTNNNEDRGGGYSSLVGRAYQVGNDSANYPNQYSGITNLAGIRGSGAVVRNLNDDTFIIRPSNHHDRDTKDEVSSPPRVVEIKPLLQSLLPLHKQAGKGGGDGALERGGLPNIRAGGAPDSILRERLLGQRGTYFSVNQRPSSLSPHREAATPGGMLDESLSTSVMPIELESTSDHTNNAAPEAASPLSDFALLIGDGEDNNDSFSSHQRSTNPAVNVDSRRRYPILHRHVLSVPKLLTLAANYVPLRPPRGGGTGVSTLATSISLKGGGSVSGGSGDGGDFGMFRANSFASRGTGIGGGRGTAVTQLGGGPGADGLKTGLDESDGKWVTTVHTVLLPNDSPGQYHVFSNVCEGKSHASKLASLGLDEKRFQAPVKVPTTKSAGSSSYMTNNNNQSPMLLPPVVLPTSTLSSEKLRAVFANTNTKTEPSKEKSAWLDNFSIDFTFTQSRYVGNDMEDEDDADDIGDEDMVMPARKIAAPSKTQQQYASAPRHRNVVVADPFSWPAADLPGTVADGIVLRNRSRNAIPLDGRSVKEVAEVISNTPTASEPPPQMQTSRSRSESKRKAGKTAAADKKVPNKQDVQQQPQPPQGKPSKKKKADGGPEASGSVVTTCADVYMPLFAITFVYGVEGDYGGVGAAEMNSLPHHPNQPATPLPDSKRLVSALRYEGKDDVVTLTTMLDACQGGVRMGASLGGDASSPSLLMNPSLMLLGSLPATTEELRGLVDGRHDAVTRQNNFTRGKVPAVNIEDAPYIPSSYAYCDVVKVADRLATLSRAASTGAIHRGGAGGSSLRASSMGGESRFATSALRRANYLEVAMQSRPAVSGAQSRWCRERVSGWEGPSLEHGRFVYYHLSEGDRRDCSVLPKRPGAGIGMFPSRSTVDTFVHPAATPLSQTMAGLPPTASTISSSANARAAFEAKMQAKEALSAQVPTHYVAIRYLPSLLRSEVTRASILSGHAVHPHSTSTTTPPSVEISEEHAERLIEEMVYFGQYVRGDGTALGGRVSQYHGYYGESKEEELRRTQGISDDTASKLARQAALGGDGAGHFERVYERRVLTSAMRDTNHPFYRIRQLMGLDYSCMLKTSSASNANTDAIAEEEVLLIRCPSLESKNALLLKFQRALVSFYGALRRFHVDNTAIAQTYSSSTQRGSNSNITTTPPSATILHLPYRADSSNLVLEGMDGGGGQTSTETMASMGRNNSMFLTVDDMEEENQDEDLENAVNELVINESLLLPVGMRRTLHMHIVRKMFFDCGRNNHSDYVSALQTLAYNQQRVISEKLQKQQQHQAFTLGATANTPPAVAAGGGANNNNSPPKKRGEGAAFGGLFDSKSYLSVPALLSVQGSSTHYNPNGAISIHRCRKDALTHVGSGFELLFDRSNTSRRRANRGGGGGGGGSRRRSTFRGVIEDDDTDSHFGDDPAVSTRLRAGTNSSTNLQQQGANKKQAVTSALTQIQDPTNDLHILVSLLKSPGIKDTGMEGIYNYLVKKARTLVSLKKRRFVGESFNLDLAYVRPDIIAMGYPSIGREALFRNPIQDTIRFMEAYHNPDGSYPVSLQSILHYLEALTRAKYSRFQVEQEKETGNYAASGAGMKRIWGNITGKSDKNENIRKSPLVTDAIVNTPAMVQDIVRAVAQVTPPPFSMSVHDQAVAKVGTRCLEFLTSIDRFLLQDAMAVSRYMVSTSIPAYRIYNLCSERCYPQNRFASSFERFPSDDHHPPPFDSIVALCASSASFLYGGDMHVTSENSQKIIERNASLFHDLDDIIEGTNGRPHVVAPELFGDDPTELYSTTSRIRGKTPLRVRSAGVRRRYPKQCTSQTPLPFDYIDASPIDRVVAIHCKAGKGRTGLMCVALTLFLGQFEDEIFLANSTAGQQRSGGGSALSKVTGEELDSKLLGHLNVPSSGVTRRQAVGVVQRSELGRGEFAVLDPLTGAPLQKVEGTCSDDEVELVDLLQGDSSSAALARMPEWSNHKQLQAALLQTDRFTSARPLLRALNWYGITRTHNNKGVSIASQMRFLEYFHWYLQSERHRLRAYFNSILEREYYRQFLIMNGKEKAFAFIAQRNPKAYIKYYHPVVWRSVSRSALRLLNDGARNALVRFYHVKVPSPSSSTTPANPEGGGSGGAKEGGDDGGGGKGVRFENATSADDESNSTPIISPATASPTSPTNASSSTAIVSSLPSLTVLEDHIVYPQIARRIPCSVPIPIHQYTHLLRPPPMPVTALSSITFSPLPKPLKENSGKCYLVILARQPNHKHIPIGQREFTSTEKDVMEIIYDSRLGVHAVRATPQTCSGASGHAAPIRTVRSAMTEESAIATPPPTDTTPITPSSTMEAGGSRLHDHPTSLMNTTLRPPPYINTATTAYYGLRNLEVQGELRFMFFLHQDTSVAADEKAAAAAAAKPPKNDKLLFSFWIHTGFLHRQRFGPCLEVYGQNTTDTGILKKKTSSKKQPASPTKESSASSAAVGRGKNQYRELQELYNSPAATKATHDLTRDFDVVGAPSGTIAALHDEQLDGPPQTSTSPSPSSSPIRRRGGGGGGRGGAGSLADRVKAAMEKDDAAEMVSDLYSDLYEASPEIQHKSAPAVTQSSHKGGVVRMYRQQLDGASKENKKLFDINFCVKLEFVTL